MNANDTTTKNSLDESKGWCKVGAASEVVYSGWNLALGRWVFSARVDFRGDRIKPRTFFFVLRLFASFSLFAWFFSSLFSPSFFFPSRLPIQQIGCVRGCGGRRLVGVECGQSVKDSTRINTCTAGCSPASIVRVCVHLRNNSSPHLS